MFDIEKVPKEMKVAMRRLYEAIARERKAKVQLELWKKEFELADQSLRVEQASYGHTSLRWNPTNQTMEPSLEEAPKSS